ncbi:MAG: AzlC family ABC transporter permease [Acidimicrobiia bacterium]
MGSASGAAFAREFRVGVRESAAMLIAVIPFGLVAGASPVAGGLGGGVALGMSAFVFAGASQLGAIEVLTAGGSAVVAALAAVTINLRMLLYSASIAPYLAREPLRRRILVGYGLIDQGYVLSMQRWGDGTRDDPRLRFPYYMGGAALMWVAWQVSTLAGVLVGPVVPEDIPLDFAAPLVFLVMLVPALTGRPAVVAAAVGATAALVVAEAGSANLAVLAGAVAGILAGTLAERAQDGPARPQPPPEPPPPGEAAP